MSGTVLPPDFPLGSVSVCVILFYVGGFSGLFLFCFYNKYTVLICMYVCFK